MKKFSNSTDIEIEKPLKNWMAQATPRLKKMAVPDKSEECYSIQTVVSFFFLICH